MRDIWVEFTEAINEWKWKRQCITHSLRFHFFRWVWNSSGFEVPSRSFFFFRLHSLNLSIKSRAPKRNMKSFPTKQVIIPIFISRFIWFVQFCKRGADGSITSTDCCSCCCIFFILQFSVVHRWWNRIFVYYWVRWIIILYAIWYLTALWCKQVGWLAIRLCHCVFCVCIVCASH